MGIIAMKFGGSSVADAAGFRRVRRIVERQGGRVYVVLSAPGKRHPNDFKMTDLLCRAHGGDGGALGEIHLRFSEIARALGLGDANGWLAELDSSIARSAGWAASRGEWVCARMFARYCGMPFVDAAKLIRFDAAGRLLREPTQCAIREMAARLPCAVIPGFYGSLPDGEIQTFPRGGSDITGALLAAALSAKRYENWTDVDGLLSADPAVCPRAIHHEAVSYRQMRRLSLAGARVLHPDCLAPAQEAGVPTILKNTFAPGNRGTYISDRVQAQVACVCHRDGLCAIPLERLGADARAVAAALAAQTFVSAQGEALAALPGFEAGQPACIVSAFGLNASELDAARADVDPIAVRLDDDCARFLVPSSRVRNAVSALHERIIEKAP